MTHLPSVAEPRSGSFDTARGNYESRRLADEINAEFDKLTEQVTITGHHLRSCLDRVFICGKLLLEAKAKFKGEFGLWCECNLKFGMTTANCYMRCTKKFLKIYEEGKLGLQSVKALYQAAGILPPVGSGRQSEHSDPLIGLWNVTKRLDNWLPSIPEDQQSRLREWWETFGKRAGFM